VKDSGGDGPEGMESEGGEKIRRGESFILQRWVSVADEFSSLFFLRHNLLFRLRSI
jgi:hypothetical protein